MPSILKSSFVFVQVWGGARVVFCTPQVFSNDLASGACDARRVVCVIVDEAHRATGQYAYTKAVDSLDKVHCPSGGGGGTGVGYGGLLVPAASSSSAPVSSRRYRLVGLTATPGADVPKVQQVVSNLHIAAIEMRTHQDPDVKPYTHDTTIDRIVVPLSREVQQLRQAFDKVIDTRLNLLKRAGLLRTTRAAFLATTALIKAREELVTKIAPRLLQKDLISLQSEIASLMSLAKMARELQVHGTQAFFASMRSYATNAGRNPVKLAVLRHPIWTKIYESLLSLDRSDAHIAHPKLVKLRQVVCEHLQRKKASGTESRVIIFTGTRTSVQEIVHFLSQSPETITKATEQLEKSGLVESRKSFGG